MLNPYRRAAFDWLTEHLDEPYVKNGIERVKGLYRRAGQQVEAYNLRGLNPQQRAKAAWARLRKAEVDPRLPLAAWLAVEMAIRNDPQPVTKVEFKRVQAAKVVHRLASGTHKRWEREVPDPNWSGMRTKIVAQEMHIYPKSRGRVLRHVGEALERAAELIADHHLTTFASSRRNERWRGASGSVRTRHGSWLFGPASNRSRVNRML